MAKYRYLIPSIAAAPPPGYRFTQILPLDALSAMVRGTDRAVLHVEREVVRSGRTLSRSEGRLRLNGGLWEDDGAGEYASESVDDVGWREEGEISYLETAITLEGEGWFDSHFLPGHYSIYSAPDKKTFFSDNNPKFGNPNTIKQIAYHRKWVEGYPVCEVDPACDANESLLVINPFEMEGSVKLHLHGLEELTPRRRIPPMSATRLDLGHAIGEDQLPWRGQVLVSGPARMVLYFVKHSFTDCADINTIEHSDVYRGTVSFRPLTLVFRGWAGQLLGRG